MGSSTNISALSHSHHQQQQQQQQYQQQEEWIRNGLTGSGHALAAGNNAAKHVYLSFQLVCKPVCGAR
jgi:hypothetical protein